MSRFVLIVLLAAAYIACSVVASEATTDGEGIVLSEAYMSCDNDEVHYGPMCTANCPSGSHELFGKHCMYKVGKRSTVGGVPMYCAPEKLALFYADKVYEVSDCSQFFCIFCKKTEFFQQEKYSSNACYLMSPFTGYRRKHYEEVPRIWQRAS